MQWMAMVLLTLTASTAAGEEMKFDLDCKGTSSVYKHGATKTDRFHQRLHVDLQSRRFCADHCDKMEPIVSVDADQIVLADEDRKVAFWTFTDRRRYDRHSGSLAVEQADLVKLESTKAEAVCRVKAFTPFPRNLGTPLR